MGADLDHAIDALSTHSLRVGLTQDLFANGEDAGPIAQALRWTSPATALRYGRKLAPSSNAAARMLKGVRKSRRCRAFCRSGELAWGVGCSVLCPFTARRLMAVDRTHVGWGRGWEVMLNLGG